VSVMYIYENACGEQRLTSSKWSQWHESNDELGGILLSRYCGRWTLTMSCSDDLSIECRLSYIVHPDESKKNVAGNFPFSCQFLGVPFRTKSLKRAKIRGMEFVENCWRSMGEIYKAQAIKSSNLKGGM